MRNSYIFSVNRIHTGKERITEGELRCAQLLKYLEKTKSPTQVFLSEDGSGIVKKVSYDTSSNQLVGIVLPINNVNGMPVSRSYMADSANEIEKHLERPSSSLVYIVTAQPIKKGIPPFILQVFGTDNRFKTNDVLKRWMFTINELLKYVHFSEFYSSCRRCKATNFILLY